MVSKSEWSLRAQVQKWLGTGAAMHDRLIHVTRSHSKKGRYLKVEFMRAGGICALFLFQHNDGDWYVFPPLNGQTELAPDQQFA